MQIGKKIALYWEFLRPFTLLAPAVGIASGGLVAYGAVTPGIELRSLWWLRIVLGAVMGAVLNGASNSLNQICDLELDRINKPMRPLPSGRMRLSEARVLAVVLFASAWALAALVGWQCLVIVLVASASVFAYSAPPIRTKRSTYLANLTIALPRGLLLPVAGWSAVKTVALLEPWVVGAVPMLFLLGAASTKDFADIKGDALGGCQTLPIKFGLRGAAYIMTPFLILPFVFVSIASWAGLLTGSPIALTVLGGVLALWGAYTSYLILRDPQELARDRNHPSWMHMYLMMLVLQLGLIGAYLA